MKWDNCIKPPSIGVRRGNPVCGNGTRAVLWRREPVWKDTLDMKQGKQLRLFTTPSNFIRLQATLYYSSFYISARA